MNSAHLHACLRRLIPHVDPTRIALTGGVAIGAYLATARMSRGFAPSDIDFVIQDVEAVYQSVTTAFLVSHFHLPQLGYPKFLIQVVDRVAGVRLDFFPDSLGMLSRATVVGMEGISLPVLQLSDILDHKLAQLASSSPENPVDPKHYADALRLAALHGRDVPVIEPSYCANTVYSHNLGEVCARCRLSQSSDFPLAPRQEIFDLLGYV